MAILVQPSAAAAVFAVLPIGWRRWAGSSIRQPARERHCASGGDPSVKVVQMSDLHVGEGCPPRPADRHDTGDQRVRAGSGGRRDLHRDEELQAAISSAARSSWTSSRAVSVTWPSAITMPATSATTSWTSASRLGHKPQVPTAGRRPRLVVIHHHLLAVPGTGRDVNNLRDAGDPGCWWCARHIDRTRARHDAAVVQRDRASMRRTCRMAIQRLGAAWRARSPSAPLARVPLPPASSIRRSTASYVSTVPRSPRSRPRIRASGRGDRPGARGRPDDHRPARGSPVAGRRLEAEVVEGRPPRTIEWRSTTGARAGIASPNGLGRPFRRLQLLVRGLVGRRQSRAPNGST